MRKHIITVSMVVLFLLSFTACAGQQTDYKNVTINYETSNTHTKEDIDNAKNAVFDQFSQFSGVELKSLTYSGDEISKDNINYCQELIDDKKIVDCIVFKSNFKTSKWAGSGWVPNTQYNWDWCVAKDSNGNWIVATYGYC